MYWVSFEDAYNTLAIYQNSCLRCWATELLLLLQRLVYKSIRVPHFLVASKSRSMYVPDR